MMMEQREELVSRSHELESAVAQLKAKDGQLLLSLIQIVLITVTLLRRCCK